MKFKTFRILTAGAVVAALGGVGFFVLRPGTTQESSPIVKSAPTEAKPAATEDKPAPAAGQGAKVRVEEPEVTPAKQAEAKGLAVTDEEREIIKLALELSPGKKVKDAFPKKPVKVNLIFEKDERRVKLDHNRNGKWEEKWTVESEGVVKRQVAPADDEQYTEKYHLAGTTWRRSKD